MNQQYKKHLQELLNISTYCNLELKPLVNTYNNKVSQYLNREVVKEKDCMSINVKLEMERALNVMTEYAVRKHHYKRD